MVRSESISQTSLENRALGYKSRHANHQAVKLTQRSKTEPEVWPIRGLHYRLGLTKDLHLEKRVVNGIELVGMETVFFDYLMKVFNAKEENSDHSVTLALDLGGMYGIPFIKVAKAFVLLSPGLNTNPEDKVILTSVMFAASPTSVLFMVML